MFGWGDPNNINPYNMNQVGMYQEDSNRVGRIQRWRGARGKGPLRLGGQEEVTSFMGCVRAEPSRPKEQPLHHREKLPGPLLTLVISVSAFSTF